MVIGFIGFSPSHDAGFIFLHGGMVVKKRNFYHVAEFYCTGSHQFGLGGRWFFALFGDLSRILYWQRTLRNHRQSF